MFLFILRECTDFNKAGHYRFTKSDLTPGEKRRISPRFDHAPGARSNISPRFDRTPGAGRIFGKYSIHVYPVAPRSQSVHSLPILQPHGRDTLLPFLHMSGLSGPGGQI